MMSIKALQRTAAAMLVFRDITAHSAAAAAELFRSAVLEGRMSTTKPDFSDPASVVKAFILQMHCWEAIAGSLKASARARYCSEDSSTMHPEEVRLSELVRQIPPFIVEIFLTKRDRAYTPSGSYSFPPSYDPGTETVTRVIPKTKSQVIVETDRKTNYMGGLREYVVKKQGDVWLIDSLSVTIGTKKMKIPLV